VAVVEESAAARRAINSVLRPFVGSWRDVRISRSLGTVSLV